ncbi:hypothetical protein P7K49_009548 [Saguinus oedipus]|uniref:Uncharacterized protein n=1 Tax=Saguinus oedipus TaxID=9490 RepID=A0ABQ9VKB0_SAGOE|nr:hypothetical protein P7K49_009548 [Saguinus oedipus]
MEGAAQLAKAPGARQTQSHRSNHSIGSRESRGHSVYPPGVRGWQLGLVTRFPSATVSPLQDEPIALDKQHSRDSAAITHSTYSLPASSYSQDPVYANGGLNYSYRGYGALSSNLQPPASLQTGNHSNGESQAAWTLAP